MADNNNPSEQGNGAPQSASDRRLEAAKQQGFIREEGAPANNAPKTKDEPAPKLPVVEDKKPEDDDIPDDVLLRALGKKGITAASVDELKPKEKELTDEEKAAAKQEKRQKAIAFGIQNKVFSQADYDASVTFGTQKADEVLLKNFKAEYLQDDPTATDADAEDAFKEKYFLLEDPATAKYKAGQKALKKEFEAIRKNQFAKIDDIETVYDQVEKTEARAKVYKAELDKVFTALPKTVPVKIGEKTFQAPINIAKLNQIKESYLTVDSMNGLLDQTGKLNSEVLTQEVLKDLIYDNLDAIVSEIANAHAEERVSEDRKGRKGIIENPLIPSEGGGPKVLTASDKRLASMNGKPN